MQGMLDPVAYLGVRRVGVEEAGGETKQKRDGSWKEAKIQ